MNRIIVFYAFFCLCVAKSDAQTRPSTLPIDSIIRIRPLNNNGINNTDSLKRVYYRRVYERIHQVSENLQYVISPNKKNSDRRYYHALICSRFHPAAMIKVKMNSAVQTYRLRSYMQHLVENEFRSLSGIRIDSISIPKWDAIEITDDTLGMVITEQEMIPIGKGWYFDNRGKGLPIVREDTEDGEEWVPLLFGDMIITIIPKEKNENEKNDNPRTILDIGNLLR